MILAIAGDLCEEERYIVDNELPRLLPDAVVSGFGEPACRIVPWHLYDENAPPEPVPQITAYTIRGMLNENVKAVLFKFPSHGLINFYLYRQRVCFTGFDRNERKHLKHLVRIMGGTCESLLSKSISVLVAKDAQSRRCSWARDHGIPVVNANWLLAQARSKVSISMDPYLLRGRLENMHISITNFNKAATEELQALIESNSGVLCKHLDAKCQYLVVPNGYDHLTRKVRIALSLGISIVTYDSLKKYVTGITNQLQTAASTFMTGSVFDGYKFLVHENCNARDLIMQSIELNGGKLNKVSYDFAIASFEVDHIENQRSPVWLERCIEEQVLLPVDVFPIYYPPKGPINLPPKTMLCLSGFKHNDHLDLLSTLRWFEIGNSRTLYKGCTALVSRLPEGHKVQTALQWKIPVYSVDWLFGILNGGDVNSPQSQLPPIAEPEVEPEEEIGQAPAEKPRIFLDDDDDDDDVFLIGEPSPYRITSSTVKSPARSPTRSPAKSPGRKSMSPRRAQLTLSPVRPSELPAKEPVKFFLDDDDDDDIDVEELEETHANHQVAPLPEQANSGEDEEKRSQQKSAEILSMSNTIKNYRKKHRRMHRRTNIEQIESLDTFTQVPVNSDDEVSSLTLGYGEDTKGTLPSDNNDDPLMALFGT